MSLELHGVIEMERPAAIKAFEEYRRAVKAPRAAVYERFRAEDLALMGAYKELAAGRRVVSITEAIKGGGMMAVPGAGADAQLPKLAVCRADAVTCYCDLDYSGGGWFGADRTWRDGPRRRQGVTPDYVVFPAGTFPRANNPSGKTMVPMVPPPFRPARGLGAYHLLWEVEAWTIVPPKDPILLKHLHGDLFAVVAQWDLTELERSVLYGRAK